MEGGSVLLAFSLTLLAGLSAGIGGLIVFFTKKTNTKFLSIALGFSAGVMIYISFVELLAEALEALMDELGDIPGAWLAVAAFFGGMLIISLVDKLVPSFDKLHKTDNIQEGGAESIEPVNENKSKLLRAGVLTALAVAIHNFPEGLVTFMATMRDPALGISIAIAIAIHNIPEGIAVSIPVYYATGSRLKAFMYSLISGIAEPIGALVGYLILVNFLSETLFGIVFAMIAGIMVFISFDQILPTARDYGEHHLTVYGLVGGMAVMAVSLLLFI